MPRKSFKTKFVDELYTNAALQLTVLDSSDESEAEEIHENLQNDVTEVCSFLIGDYVVIILWTNIGEGDETYIYELAE
jgi:hypothetical protein